VANLWFVLSERYGFDGLLTRVSALSRGDRWETLARAALRDDLYGVLREFTTSVLTHAVDGSSTSSSIEPRSAVATWEGLHASRVERARQTLSEVERAARADLPVLSVALRTLRTVLSRG
jgi:glutamate dehydrogenase